MSNSEGPVVYDKGKYHLETVGNYGLPESHAYHHTVYFLRWLLEHDLMSDFFRNETQPFDRAAITNDVALRVYEEWDTCLIDDLLSDEGNAFAQTYFDFGKGKYIKDYMGLLQGKLPSEFHIPLTEENYQRLKPIIDRRYAEWKARAHRPSLRSAPPPAPVNRASPPPAKVDVARPKRWWEFWRR